MLLAIVRIFCHSLLLLSADHVAVGRHVMFGGVVRCVVDGGSVVVGLRYMSISSLEVCLIIVKSRKMMVLLHSSVGMHFRAGCMHLMWSRIVCRDVLWCILSPCRRHILCRKVWCLCLLSVQLFVF